MSLYEDMGITVDEMPMYNHDHRLSTSSRLHESFKDRFLEILSAAGVWIMKRKQ
ncbi:MAG TPA: hypothetical protein VIS48_13625 [Candidatus Kryptonia bacterium]